MRLLLSNAMVNMFEAITESSQDIFYNDFPGTGKTLALNCIDTTINATQALLICGTMDSVFYAYSKTMELVNLIQPNINARLVTETAFYNHDPLQTTHLVIGVSRAVVAINHDPNMLKLVCIDDAENECHSIPDRNKGQTTVRLLDNHYWKRKNVLKI